MAVVLTIDITFEIVSDSLVGPASSIVLMNVGVFKQRNEGRNRNI